MSSTSRKRVDLQAIDEDALLGVRICDLPVAITGSWLEECIAQLYRELEAVGMTFLPACFLTDEWMTPEHEPVIGIPFFLAHPTLIRLERKMMLEAEGETRDWCMKLLRHEAGHAISYAYRLQRMRRWQRVFGRASKEYSETYRFRPYSKSFVRHLDYFYAQYHPDEDFVETFAVWLTPGSDWRTKYQGWKALEKLLFVERLFKELAGRAPVVKRGVAKWKASTLRATLKSYYRRRRHSEAEDYPDFHDPNLRRIFVERDQGNHHDQMSAVQLIQRHRRVLLDSVSSWTGERKFMINEVLKAVASRCRTLRLVTVEPEPVAVLRLSTYVTTLMMNYRYTGWFRGEKRAA